MSAPDAMAGEPAVVAEDGSKDAVADAPTNAGPTTTAADQADAASIRTGGELILTFVLDRRPVGQWLDVGHVAMTSSGTRYPASSRRDDAGRHVVQRLSVLALETLTTSIHNFNSSDEPRQFTQA